MNKLAKIIILIAGLVVLSICAFFTYSKFNDKLNSYIEISYEELMDKIDSDEKFVLFIGSEHCSHCTRFKTTLDRVVKDYKIEVFYIDLSKLEDEEYAYVNSHFPFSGTPTTIVIEKGVEYKRQTCRIDGAKNYEFVVNRLKKAGII